MKKTASDKGWFMNLSHRHQWYVIYLGLSLMLVMGLGDETEIWAAIAAALNLWNAGRLIQRVPLND